MRPPQKEAITAAATAPRWWVLSARACLAVAFAGWVAIVAGYAQHQERLGLTAGAPASLDNPEQLLDRISSFALLHDAKYFARHRATLDPGRGFQKFYWLNAVEAAALLLGAAATVWPYSQVRTLASGLLATGQVADLPESAVEIVANYRALGVRLPSYRIAQVVGAAVVPSASFVAAMVLGWNPAWPGPDVTAVVPPPPEARGMNRVQARMERAYLGTLDKLRRRVLLACVTCAWVCTAVGWIAYGVGVASGKWWPTHVPLCAIALAVQVVANTACAVALLPAVEGRASGTALAAVGAGLILNIWRINRSWLVENGRVLTLVALRTPGVHAPPGYITYNAATILWLVAASGIALIMGFREPQAGDERFRALPYRVTIAAVVWTTTLTGALLCTIATLAINSQENERRMWAGEVAFSQSGDRWWLMYTLTIYQAIFVQPFHAVCPMVLARSRETITYGCLAIAFGTNYMVNKSTNVAVNVGLWLVGVGFILATVITALATDSPRGVHTYPARAWRAVTGPCTGGGRRGAPETKPLLVAHAADPEAGGPHAVSLLLPTPGAAGGGRPAQPSSTDVVLRQLVGTGSFASVFRASYGGAPVAVKVLSAASPVAQAAARREAQLALSLRHPCVLQTFAVLDVDVDGPALLASTASASWASESQKTLSSGSRPSTAGAAVLAEFGTVLQAPSEEDGVGSVGSSGGGGGGLDGTTTTSGTDTATMTASTSDSPWPPALRRDVSLRRTASSWYRRQTWLVLELADRGTLERAIRKGTFRPKHRPLPRALSSSTPPGSPAQPLGVVKPAKKPPATSHSHAALLATLHDIAAALTYLHRVGIIHGDLKPANVLLKSRARDRAGRRFSAVVADFGLSQTLTAHEPGGGGGGAGAAPTHIFTHTFGTVCFAAPEMIREGRLSRAADCYALGMVLFESFLGVPAFHQMPPAAIFYCVGVEGRRPSLDGFEAAPPGYVELMTALWADQPDERPTAAQAAQRLKAMLDAELAALGGRAGKGSGGGQVGVDRLPARPSYRQRRRAAGQPGVGGDDAGVGPGTPARA